MKKILKITGITILVLLIILLVGPFLFKGTIEDLVKKSINENINATVAWEDLSLNLFSSFPDARLSIENISVINKAPFAGDTLVWSREIALDMGVLQLFSMDEGLSINELAIHDAKINIKTDSLGRANYDIAKESTSNPVPSDTTSSSSALSFDVQHYEITDSQINYRDESAGIYFQLKDLNHEGTGDFSATKSALKTQSSTLVSFAMDSLNYFDELPIKLQATIQMDFENQKFSFLENKALINQLPLIFDGFVKLNKENTAVDINFKTPSSTFKNFLAVIPKAYSKNIENVTTSGTFSISGKLSGIVDDQHVPKMAISIRSEDAAFKYPDLPQKVKNITIKADLFNKTGLLKDTYLNLDLLSFQIDQDVFTAHGSFKNLTENMRVDMTAKGRINLANIEKAYPVDLEQELNGVLQMDTSMHFDMASLENENYENIQTNGKISLSDFDYNSPEFPNPVAISAAKLNFSNNEIVLENFEAKSGQSDAKISGNLDNLMGFLFADQDLKGHFNLSSQTFALNDFMPVESESVEEKEKSTDTKTEEVVATTEENIQIPSFLDVSFDFSANQVLYDNLTLRQVKGTLILKDETARLENVTSSIFNGTIGLDGQVSTKKDTPTFAMELDLSRIDISESFNGLELLQNIAPIAKALKGTLNTTIVLSGNLNNDLTPVLTSLTGNALAELLTAKVDPEKATLLSKLSGHLNFLKLEKIDLHDLSTKVSFENGNVHIKPFSFKVGDIGIQVAGKHSFSNTMDYQLTLDLPAKYLGSELGGLVANLSDADLKNMRVDLPVDLTGTFSAPSVKVNTEKAVKTLSQKIVANQKEKLTQKASDALGNIFNKNNVQTDSTSAGKKEPTKEEKIKNTAGKILGNLFGKKPNDSTP